MQILTIAEIIVAVTIIVFILFQQRGTALGAAFGDSGGGYSTRRGLQNKLYWATIILTAAFIILALVDLII